MSSSNAGWLLLGGSTKGGFGILHRIICFQPVLEGKKKKVNIEKFVEVIVHAWEW